MATAIMDFVQRFNTIQLQRDTSDELIKVLYQAVLPVSIFPRWLLYEGGSPY
jgi:hypothetical protein